MLKSISAISIAAFASGATAQTGTYLWQVSSDNGATWGNFCDPLAGQTVKVRVRAFWSGITAGPDQGFAAGQFDVTLENATAADTVSNIQRPTPFAFASQTLAASTYAGGVKIDTAADLAAPGLGTGWVYPSQPPIDIPETDLNTENGAIIFQFNILYSGTTPFITVGEICNPATGRAMSIYASAVTNTQVRMNASQVTVQTAQIGVPNPGSLALLGIGGIAASRRRRQCVISQFQRGTQ